MQEEDVTCALDNIILKLPGNFGLQCKLGIIIPGTKVFETLSDIEWNDQSSAGIPFAVALKTALGLLKVIDDDEIYRKNLLEEIILISSRYLVLQQIIGKRIVIDDPACDLIVLTLYYQGTIDRLVYRLKKLASEIGSVVRPVNMASISTN